MGIIDPYVVLPKDVAPKFWPIFDSENNFHYDEVDKIKRGYPWLNLSRLEWENKGEIDHFYFLFLNRSIEVGDFNAEEHFDKELNMFSYHMSTRIYFDLEILNLGNEASGAASEWISPAVAEEKYRVVLD